MIIVQFVRVRWLLMMARLWAAEKLSDIEMKVQKDGGAFHRLLSRCITLVKPLFAEKPYSKTAKGNFVFELIWTEPVDIFGNDPHRVYGARIITGSEHVKRIAGEGAVALRPRNAQGGIIIFVHPNVQMFASQYCEYVRWRKSAIEQLEACEISQEDYSPEVYAEACGK